MNVIPLVLTLMVLSMGGVLATLVTVPGTVIAGMTVKITQALIFSSAPYLYVGSVKSEQPCSYEESTWNCIVPVGVKLGPQHVALDRPIKLEDPTVIVIDRASDFYGFPKSKKDLAQSLGVRPVLSSLGNASGFRVISTKDGTILQTIPGQSPPSGLSAPIWQKSLDYLNNRALVVVESRLGQTPQGIPFVSSGAISAVQLKELARLQGISTGKPVLPVVASQDAQGLAIPPPPARTVNFEALLGKSVGQFRSQLEFLKLTDGSIRYTPTEVNQITHLVKKFQFTEVNLSDPPKPDPMLPNACTEVKELEPLPKDTSIEEFVRAVDSLIATGNVVGGFDPNTDPWGATRAAYVGASNVVPLNKQTGLEKENVRAFLIDTWKGGGAIDPYEGAASKGHGITVSQIIRARAQVAQNLTVSLNACPASECRSVKVLTVIDQICSAIAEHQRQFRNNKNFKSIINLSLSFQVPNLMLEETLKLAMKEGIYIITSHGNLSACLNHQQGDQCNAFPADYVGRQDMMSGVGQLWSVSAQLNGGTLGQPAGIARQWLTNVPTGQPHWGVLVSNAPSLYAPFDFNFTYPTPSNESASKQAITYPSSYVGTSFSAAYVTGTMLWYLQKCGHFPEKNNLQALVYSGNSNLNPELADSC